MIDLQLPQTPDPALPQTLLPEFERIYFALQRLAEVAGTGGGGGGGSPAYNAISVIGQALLAATAGNTTLALVAGSGITFTTNPAGNALTVNSSSGPQTLYVQETPPTVSVPSLWAQLAYDAGTPYIDDIFLVTP